MEASRTGRFPFYMYLLRVTNHVTSKSRLQLSKSESSSKIKMRQSESFSPGSTSYELSGPELAELKEEFKVRQIADAIVDSSPIQELKLAINVIVDDDYVILKGDVDRTGPPKVARSSQKKSIYRGVSLNGKKWQVSSPSADSLSDHGHGQQPKILLAVSQVRVVSRQGLRPVPDSDYGPGRKDKLLIHTSGPHPDHQGHRE